MVHINTISGIDNLSYKERLQKIKLPTLEYHRLRRDRREQNSTWNIVPNNTLYQNVACIKEP